MPLKETPLLKAMDNPDPLPRILTMTYGVAGFTATLACAFFSGVAMMFLFSTTGGRAANLFGPVRAGALGGALFAAVVMVLIYTEHAFD